jgi:hypothetical protein
MLKNNHHERSMQYVLIIWISKKYDMDKEVEKQPLKAVYSIQTY